MAPALTYSELADVGCAAGLDVVGACSAEPFPETRAVLEERKAAGLNGAMQFTYRNPARSTEHDRALPGAATLLVGACSYHRDPPPRPAADGPVARVGRYVWADDQDRLLRGLARVSGEGSWSGWLSVPGASQDVAETMIVAVEFDAGGFHPDWPAPQFQPGDTDVF